MEITYIIKKMVTHMNVIKKSSQLRKVYKETLIGEVCYLYPLPVIKEHKYLIRLDRRFSDFFIDCFHKSYLESPDTRPPYIENDGTHSDGNTKVIKICYDALVFEFLPDRELDLKKAKTIELLISKKIIDVLNEVPNSIQDLEKRFMQQKECSTCQKLGILEPSVEAFISIIKK